MDARRGQVYTGLYAFEDGEMKILHPADAIAVEQIVEECNGSGKSITFLGDGVGVYRSRIEEQIQVPHFYAPAHLNKQRAGAVAALGSIKYKKGETVSAEELVPVYLRLSQAERERAEREKAGKRCV